MAEAYGPVVLKPAGRSWRSRRSSGGGCLYDYAAHPLDLLTWYFGEPSAVAGSTMTSIFSKDIDDAVTSTVRYADGMTAQLSANWSDESKRKMTTSVRNLGNRWPHRGRPAEPQGVPAGHRAGAGGLRAGLERQVHDRAHAEHLVLPAGRGVQRPAGRVREKGPGPPGRRTEHLRLGLGDRPRDRHDRGGCPRGADTGGRAGPGIDRRGDVGRNSNLPNLPNLDGTRRSRASCPGVRRVARSARRQTAGRWSG